MRNAFKKGEAWASGCEHHDRALHDQMGRTDSGEVEDGWRGVMPQRTTGTLGRFRTRGWR
jgi:hypothetical protein